MNGDSSSAAPIRVAAPSAPATGVWYHLVGVYDATAHQIKLYVNGVL